jgi:hypothetical protein
VLTDVGGGVLRDLLPGSRHWHFIGGCRPAPGI